MAAFFRVSPRPEPDAAERDTVGRVAPEVLVVSEVAEPAPAVGFAPVLGLVVLVRAGLVVPDKSADGRAPAVSEATREVSAGRVVETAGLPVGLVVLVTGRPVSGRLISEVRPGISPRTATSRAGKLGKDCLD